MNYHFTHNGRAFTARTEADDTQDAPWDREDGHGPVRIMSGSSCYFDRPSKRPGERFLAWDRGYGLAYDWQEACKRARAEGWNTAPFDAPHRVHRAVLADFKRLQAWCTGDWSYVGVIVTADDGEGEPVSLWGIESDCWDYLQEVAHQLADEFEPAYVHALGA